MPAKNPTGEPDPAPFKIHLMTRAGRGGARENVPVGPDPTKTKVEVRADAEGKRWLWIIVDYDMMPIGTSAGGDAADDGDWHWRRQRCHEGNPSRRHDIEDAQTLVRFRYGLEQRMALVRATEKEAPQAVKQS
jgi:hypothetical protein